MSESKVRSNIDGLDINTESQRTRLRQCLKANTPSNIRKLSLEICIAAMRTEIHIVKFKSHPTGKIRGCLRCNDEVNKNIIDVLAPHNIHNHIWLKYLQK